MSLAAEARPRTIPRRLLVDWQVTRDYHCISRHDAQAVTARVGQLWRDARRAAAYRLRLADPGRCLKARKRPLARRANQEDDGKGTF
jgi:uncharacterized protein (DUF3084 family)